MRTSILTAITLALLTASAAAVAAQDSGHYYNHVTSEKKIPLPNGNTAILSHFFEMTTTDNANDPMDHLAGSCSAQSIVSKDGKTLAGSGVCFSKDSDGNSLTHWFKLDETGTARCPHGCGSYGYLAGTGKFNGVTGGGTWKQTHKFGDVASSGTFKQTSSKP
jgi:hypothetical protein